VSVCAGKDGAGMCCDALFIPLLSHCCYSLLNTRQQLPPLHQFDVPQRHAFAATIAD
jgi:hypothetical protein